MAEKKKKLPSNSLGQEEAETMLLQWTGSVEMANQKETNKVGKLAKGQRDVEC